MNEKLTELKLFYLGKTVSVISFFKVVGGKRIG